MAKQISLLEYREKYGPRKAAIALMDQFLKRKIGMSFSELPDSPELCDYVDELENLVENHGHERDFTKRPDVVSIYSSITDENFLMDLILG